MSFDLTQKKKVFSFFIQTKKQKDELVFSFMTKHVLHSNKQKKPLLEKIAAFIEKMKKLFFSYAIKYFFLGQLDIIQMGLEHRQREQKGQYI